jgi:hypothetical protein
MSWRLFNLRRYPFDRCRFDAAVESADSVPPVTIAFQHNAVFAGFVRPTVVLSEKINQRFVLFAICRWTRKWRRA